MAEFNLVAECLSDIEAAYKRSVCGHPPQSADSQDRWAKAFVVWVPVPGVLMQESADDAQSVCRKLSDCKLIESVRFLTDDDDVHPSIPKTMRLPGAVYFHVVCVPFKDLVIC